MEINMLEVNQNSGFYIVGFETFAQTLEESEIVESWDMGAVTIHYGTKDNAPIWLMDNPAGSYGVWLEEPRH